MEATSELSEIMHLFALVCPELPCEADTPVLSLGMSSLAATRFLLSLEQDLGLKSDLEFLAAGATLRDVAERTRTGLIPGRYRWAANNDLVVVGAEGTGDSVLPFLPLQQAYMVAADVGFGGDGIGSHIYREFEIEDIDPLRAVNAWDCLFNAHPILSAVVEVAGLRVGPVGRLPVEVVETTAESHHLAVAAERERLSARVDRSSEPFVIRLVHSPNQVTGETSSGSRTTMHLSIDALLIDGHGLQLLLQQWRSLIDNPSTSVLPGGSVTRCIDVLHRRTTSAKDRAYWHGVLDDSLEGPFAATARTGGRPVPRRPLEQSIDRTVWGRAKEWASQAGITPTSLVLSLFTEVVLDLAQLDRAAIVVTTSERYTLGSMADGVIGPFTSSIIAPVGRAAGETLEERGVRLQIELWEHLDHSAMPGVEVVREIWPPNRPPALPVVFTSLLGIETAEPGDFALNASYVAGQTSGIALEHQMWEQDGELVLHWDVADRQLPPATAELGLTRLRARLENVVASLEAAVRPAELQQGYIMARLGEDAPDRGECQVTFAAEVSEVDPDLFRSVWTALVAETPSLRTSPRLDGVMATVQASVVAPVVVIVADPEVPWVDAKAGLMDAHQSLKFPLGQGPHHAVSLLLGSSCGLVVVTMDLILHDGRSCHQVMRSLLWRLAGETEPDLPPSPDLTRYGPLDDGTDNVDYWQARIDESVDPPSVARLGGDWVRRSAVVPGLGAVRETVGDRPWLDAVIMAALSSTLDDVFGSPTVLSYVGWDRSDDDDRPTESSCFSWWFGAAESDLRTRSHVMERTIIEDHHRDSRLGMRTFRSSRARRASQASGHELQSIVYTATVDWGRHAHPSNVTEFEWATRTPGVSLDVVSRVTGDDLEIHWDSLDAHFDAGVLERGFAAFVELLREEDVAALLDALPSIELGQLDVEATTPIGRGSSGPQSDDLLELLYRWNRTTFPYRADQPIHRLFEAAADRLPDKVAITWSGGQLTFDELERQANRIANRLIDRGVTVGDRVALGMRRGPNLIAAVFAVLKAGATYVPIEPDQPALRATKMLDQASCSLVLTDSATDGWTPPDGLESIVVDSRSEMLRSPEVRPDPGPITVDELAYIIFTSGSTGSPKGVAVSHRPLHNLFNWAVRTHHFDENDIGLCVTSLGFDLSAFDVLGLLGLGASIYLADEVERVDPALLANIVVAHNITFWNSAPTTLDHVRPFFDGWARSKTVLRLIYLSGDYTPLSLADEILQMFPSTRLVSLGGATEATIWSNWHDVDAINSDWRSIPYGRPIDNARYYILDADRRPLRPGVDGDLYIAGDVLSTGYVGSPELTAERFMEDPFFDGERMYFTGDRAMFLDDGVISFLGRVDNQVKLRGHRIELGEIEHALRDCEGVVDAVVIVRSSGATGDRLVAYVTADVTGPSVADLRKRLQEVLPGYMVPSMFCVLDRFPATANGKLDRSGLPWPLSAPVDTVIPEPTESERSAVVDDALSSVASVEEIHRFLVELFESLLETGVDPTADLWDQGATSFTVVQANAALAEWIDVRLPVEFFVGQPTIGAMAQEVMALAGGSSTEISVGVSEPSTSDWSPQPDPVEAGLGLFDPKVKADVQRQMRTRQRHRAGSRLGLPIPVQRENGDRDRYDDICRGRESTREFGQEVIDPTSLAQLIELCRPRSIDGTARYLYPSAGDIYGIDLAIWVRPHAIEGVEGGIYHIDLDGGELIRSGEADRFSRSNHVVYNRDLHERSAFTLFLIGNTGPARRIYGDLARDYLLTEAGYLGHLMVRAQVETNLGLCPVGSVSTDGLADPLDLGPDREILHCLIGGRLTTESRRRMAVAEAPAPNGPELEQHQQSAFVAGQAGRYPGANSIDQFWRLLETGATAVTPGPHRPGLPADTVGGFLEQIDRFDPLLFKIAPVEAAAVDPQARILLEVVWECLERSGTTQDQLEDGANRTGVFVGHLWNDYYLTGAAASGGPIAAMGSELANRISHTFGFTGPSVAVDTSCSSSLTALHLALEALRAGHCSSAVVCGVNLIAHPNHVDVVSEMGFLAQGPPGGAYDSSARGWFLGEGAGAILLGRVGCGHPLEPTAVAAIEATAIGHPGGKTRFGAPSPSTIAETMTMALNGAGVEPEDVGYIECAAAGAVLADVAELEAIESVFSPGVLIGTVKPNVGHLEAASGMSQLTKVLCQFAHGSVAPTIVGGTDLPGQVSSGRIRIASGTEPTPDRVLVSAIGSTGSTAAVVVASPRTLPVPAPTGDVSGPSLLLLSAATIEQLADLVDRTVIVLGTLPAHRWLDLCRTSQCGRIGLRFRLAVPAESAPEALSRLRLYRQGPPDGSDGKVLVTDVDSAAGPDLTDAVLGERPRSEWHQTLIQWLQGDPIDWRSFWSGPARIETLPTYPFGGRSYWVSGHDDDESGDAGSSRLADPPDQKVAATSRPVAADNHRWLKVVMDAFTSAAEIDAGQVNPAVQLDRYGLSSRIATRAAQLVNDVVGRNVLSPMAFYESPDLRGVAGALAGTNPPPYGPSDDQIIDSSPAGLDEATDPGEVGPQAIAVVGMAGRFAGADSVDQLWDHLVRGADLVDRLPPARHDRWWSADGANGNFIGSFLDDVASFDCGLFGVTPIDAARIDPQERLALEVAREALDDAFHPQARLADHLVGVYMGVMQHDYPMIGVDMSDPDWPVDLGSSPAGVANRISYHFDLRGPSMTVDTMCSSSLTAIRLAVDALRSGACDLALAGGVSLALHPNKFHQQRRLGMAAARQRCRAFAADADGFVPGEGAGCLVLKPIDHAIRDGDRIHAVLRGATLNHGGRANGYTVPNPLAQAELIGDAVEAAGVDPNTISYLEAHGTGTRIGDPIEASGIVDALDPDPSVGLTVGSIKANLGHLEAAAGVAGLIKVILQLRHRQLVPQIHAEPPNPDVVWGRLRVAGSLEQWLPRNENGVDVWRAGVSSFGAGGSNAHVIVESGPEQDQREQPWSSEKGPNVLMLSAADPDSLGELGGLIADQLERYPDLSMAGVSHTLRYGRDHLEHRWAAVVGDRKEAVAALRVLAENPLIDPPPNPALARIAISRGSAVPGAEPVDSVGLVHGQTASVQAWISGAPIADRQTAWRNGCFVDLPHYPYRRTRCWHDDLAAESRVIQSGPPAEAAPLPPTIDLSEATWTAVDDQDPNARGKANSRRFVVVAPPDMMDIGSKLAARLDGTVVLTGSDVIPTSGSGPITFVPLTAWTPAGFGLLHHFVSGPARPTSLVLPVAGLFRRHEVPVAAAATAEQAAYLYALGATGHWPIGGSRENLSVTTAVVDLPNLGDSFDIEISADVIRRLASAEIGGDFRVDNGRLMKATWRAQQHRGLKLDQGPVVVGGPTIDRSAVHLLTGGSQGIGLEIAGHLVESGVRRLVVVSRRSSPELTALSDVMTARGGELRTVGCSVADRSALSRLLEPITKDWGPITRVVHAAGVGSEVSRVVDAVLAADLDRVLEPKVQGLAALVDVLGEATVDSIVCLSSVSGSMDDLVDGVADYAMANRAMDYLAASLNLAGVPVTTLAFPVWSTSTASTSARLATARLGLKSIESESGLRLLEAALARSISGRLVVAPVGLLSSSATDLAGSSFDLDPARDIGDEVGDPVNRPGPTSDWVDVVPSPDPRGLPEVDLWVAEVVARRTGLAIDRLDVNRPLAEFGVESMMLGQLTEDLEAICGAPVDPTVILDNPTIASLAKALSPPARSARVETVVPAADRGDRSWRDHEVPDEGAIAIVGAAARFPGASDLVTLWNNLVQGVDAVVEVPPDRWSVADTYDPAGGPGTSISRWGGFIEDLAQFDPDYFGLTDVEAVHLDPAIRLFLEQIEVCIADAGYRSDELDGLPVGIFAGARLGDYGRHFDLGDRGRGADQNFVTALAAHIYNWTGPNLVVDSACSSSLAAVHLACSSLRLGETDVVMAGGVDVLVDESVFVQFTAAGALSKHGRCATFDASADGFVPGEGCGVVMLKRLADAMRDGDRIRGVIRGSALNNDGRTMGSTTPNPRAQQEVVRSALRQAGCTPDQIGLIEAHGTGTVIGDPIELQALREVFTEKSFEANHCAIGSIKSNIGHLLSAAGIAGLLKVLLAVEIGVIPPTLHCLEPNPRFDFENSPFRVATESTPWPEPNRLGSVSAFGLGGSNAHAVLGPSPSDHRPRRRPLPNPNFHRRRFWHREPEQSATSTILDITLRPAQPAEAKTASQERRRAKI